MDTETLDRVSRILAGAGPRRKAVRLLAAAGLAAAGAAAAGDARASHKHKKRCTRRVKKCTSDGQCCNRNAGSVCGTATDPIKPQCARFVHRVCCGQEHAPCVVANHGCDCCGGLVCDSDGPSSALGTCAQLH